MKPGLATRCMAFRESPGRVGQRCYSQVSRGLLCQIDLRIINRLELFRTISTVRIRSFNVCAFSHTQEVNWKGLLDISGKPQAMNCAPYLVCDFAPLIMSHVALARLQILADPKTNGSYSSKHGDFIEKSRAVGRDGELGKHFAQCGTTDEQDNLNARMGRRRHL